MLYVNNKCICSMCFSEINSSGECTNCSGKSNCERFPTVLREGTVLAGKYSVGTVLGKGGFGVTYLCYDMKNDKVVAIKEYMPDTLSYRAPGTATLSSYEGEKANSFKAGAEKFFEEAKLVSTFQNVPGVIDVYEFFYENNTAYYVMEYINGVDLKDYIKMKGGRLTPEEVVYIMAKLSEVLKSIHNAKVLHRDISPDNIFVCHDGNVKLIDFGAARQVLGEASKSLSVILKQGFAPLEQYKKKGNQGPWTDIYALGATMYYALTGKVIDDAMTRFDDETLDMRGIPEDIAALLIRMLKVNISERCQSANELILEIADIRVGQKIPEIPGNSHNVANDTPVSQQQKGSDIVNNPKVTSGGATNPVTSFIATIKNQNTNMSLLRKVLAIVAIVIVAVGLGIGGRIVYIHSKYNFVNGYAVIERNSKYGVVNSLGFNVLEPKYDAIEDLTDGTKELRKDGKYGLCRTKDYSIIVPIEHDLIYELDDGNIRLVKEDGDSDKRGLYVIDQDKVVPAEYDLIFDMENGYAEFKKDGKYGLFDKDYNVVVPAEYDFIYDMENGYAEFKNDGKYGLFDQNYDVVVPAEYDLIFDVQPEGYARFKKDNRYGLFDKNYKVVVPAEYDYILDFYNGYARFSKDDKYGKFDLNLNEIYD